jgi:hypothetical protein
VRARQLGAGRLGHGHGLLGGRQQPRGQAAALEIQRRRQRDRIGEADFVCIGHVLVVQDRIGLARLACAPGERQHRGRDGCPANKVTHYISFASMTTDLRSANASSLADCGVPGLS